MLRAWAVALGLALGISQPAAAQNPFAPALTVNQAVITHYDIDQRARFLEALGASGDVRALAIEQLTEDRIKLQAAEDMGLELTEEAIEAGIEEFAQQRGITLEDVARVMNALNIDRQTLEDFVGAGLVWREIVSSRFRERAIPSEADLDAALGAAANAPMEMVQLAEIAIPFEEHGEAEALALADRLTAEIRRGATSWPAAVQRYSRSASAAQDGLLPPVPAAQLPPAIRGQILLMRPGEVAEPLPIAGGVAVIRLVSTRLEPRPTQPAMPEEEQRDAMREQLFLQRITSFGQGYLQELMGDALIVEQ